MLSVLGMVLLAMIGGFAVAQVLREIAEPVPTAAASPVTPTPLVTPTPARGLRPSRPVRLEIPVLRVRTRLLSLGKNADGTLQVPPPDRTQQAGWYRFGATPGARGPAVIAGHIDSRTGPAVFYRLAELKPGDEVRVLRKDRRTVIFRIDSVTRVPKTSFPTGAVYGDLAYPGIRLITCGGAFDRTAGRYADNVIAYGHLLKVRKPAKKARSTRSAAPGPQGTP